MIKTVILGLAVLCMGITTTAQELTSKTFDGLKFRSIGPAFTGGRIADIAIDPNDENIWYVAVASGGVWCTTNSGITWKPIFDNQTSYSIGCVTIDPNNSHTIWVGTGENNGGRHIGFGDGIYKSTDDGQHWTNMGLKNSEHLSKIIVHPENPDILWVASQGPLWSKGGDRGIYKSTDRGKTWKKTLGDAEWTGAADLVIDPTNPDVLYAATWQRQRTVAAYLGGGPGSGIYKSTDGGETWKELKNGIPKSNLGKIGLAISPFDSEVIYAAIETDRTTGGFFMSSNGGGTWKKQSDEIGRGTGPLYYQEIFASPHQKGRIYFTNNSSSISDDDGKTFHKMNEKNKHGDSHSVVFKKSDPNFVLFGTDGGLYATYDLTKTWRFFPNLPVQQYYKISVDDAMPFYHVFGGTQDNGSNGGPSGTTSSGGITNGNWWKTLGADGYGSATEPGNPNIVYGEFQKGVLWRVDEKTGEAVFIQPQPRAGEPYERFNWDAPILISPHNPTRIYFASQRVWRSDNRGDKWTPISGDLTQDEVRLSLPIMGKQQSWDNAWDLKAMSDYNTITSLAESSKQEGLIYAGTDDGIIQVTDNGGKSWTKTTTGSIKGVPEKAFVNDLRADLFDENVVYAALDNHKTGDYSPYLIKSSNKGKTWTSIRGDLPGRTIVWRLVQDQEDKDLLFAATEFGIYFTKNGGTNWIQLKGGLPTISFRDITIQRRDGDLVGGSFGRGIYILDNIAPLRSFNKSMLTKEATLFNVKPALLFVQHNAVGGQGDSQYEGKNAPYGAVFNYYLADSLKTLQAERKLKEKDGKNISFPGWKEVEAEKLQQKPAILLLIEDYRGKVVNTIEGTNKKGFNCVNWPFDYADRSGIDFEKMEKGGNEEENNRYNILATPGDYSVTLLKKVDGKTTTLAGPKPFKIIPLQTGTLQGDSPEEIMAFRTKAQEFQQDIKATKIVLEESLKRVQAMQVALNRAESPDTALSEKIYAAQQKLLDIDKRLNGDKTRESVGEHGDLTPGIGTRIVIMALNTTYGPTQNHKEALQRANTQLATIKNDLQNVRENELSEISKNLKPIGAPWIEGDGLINE